MRLYFAVAPQELTADEFEPRTAYAVTPGLAAALPDEDEEGHEASAFLAAADVAVECAGEGGRRIVIAADAPARALPGEDEHPGAVHMEEPVLWPAVAAVFVDAMEAVEDVRAAAHALAARLGAGGEEDDAALVELLERAAGHDLLWYDPSERRHVVVMLREGTD